MMSRPHLFMPGSNTEVCRPLFLQLSHLAAALVRIPTSINLTMLLFNPSYAVFWSSLSSMASSDRPSDEKSRQDAGYNNQPNTVLCPSPQHTLVLVPSSCSAVSSFALLRFGFLNSCRSLVHVGSHQSALRYVVVLQILYHTSMQHHSSMWGREPALTATGYSHHTISVFFVSPARYLIGPVISTAQSGPRLVAFGTPIG